MVGAAGFELATLCSQSRCATRLRYAPTKGGFYLRLGVDLGRQHRRCSSGAVRVGLSGRDALDWRRDLCSASNQRPDQAELRNSTLLSPCLRKAQAVVGLATNSAQWPPLGHAICTTLQPPRIWPWLDRVRCWPRNDPYKILIDLQDRSAGGARSESRWQLVAVSRCTEFFSTPD